LNKRPGTPCRLARAVLYGNRCRIRIVQTARRSSGPVMARMAKGKYLTTCYTPLQGRFHEVNEECKSDIVHPDRSQQPPRPWTERPMQIPDRKQRQKVGKYERNPEENEQRDRRRGANPAEPSNQAYMDEMRRSKSKAKVARSLFQGLEPRAEQGRQRAPTI